MCTSTTRNGSWCEHSTHQLELNVALPCLSLRSPPAISQTVRPLLFLSLIVVLAGARRQFPFGVLLTVVGVVSLAARHSAQNPPPSPMRYGERPDSGDMSDNMKRNMFDVSKDVPHEGNELQVHLSTRQTSTSVHVASSTAVFLIVCRADHSMYVLLEL